MEGMDGCEGAAGCEAPGCEVSWGGVVTGCALSATGTKQSDATDRRGRIGRCFFNLSSR
jgi:hypothetical protein